jgi:hypothetical protein
LGLGASRERGSDVTTKESRVLRRKAPSSNSQKDDTGSIEVPAKLCRYHILFKSTRIRITLRENLLERSVVAVDVVVKMNDSILSHDNGAIDD